MFLHPLEHEFTQAFGQFLLRNPFDDATAEAALRRINRIDLGLAQPEAARPSLGPDHRPLVNLLVRRSEALLEQLRERLMRGERPENHIEARSYQDLFLGSVYLRTFEGGQPTTAMAVGTGRVSAFRPFVELCRYWMEVPLEVDPFFHEPPHMFAICYQLRRAFELIGSLLQGNSRPINSLRAAIWNSIVPHELRLYGNLLYNRMHEVTTLILGPSGTGKELAASAIGLSRYVPFDSRRECFVEPVAAAFHPINLSALSRDLVESEMFGHAAGAFTGATRDRTGWFEKCAAGHTVFLDEIGELDERVQVKLLRVLQSREFHRVGETEPQRFEGRIIAATNRDLGAEIAGGRFREDLYYRLCSDVLFTPTLRQQLDDCPSDLPFLVRLIAAKCLGEKAWPEQIDWLTNLTVRWIETSPEMGQFYSWPGNFRELEQCVRSVMVRGEYHPAQHAIRSAIPGSNQPAAPHPLTALDRLVSRLRAGDLTFDELTNHYCSLIYSRSASLTEAARRLDKHRATVESRVVPELVDQYRSQRAEEGGLTSAHN